MRRDLPWPQIRRIFHTVEGEVRGGWEPATNESNETLMRALAEAQHWMWAARRELAERDDMLLLIASCPLPPEDDQ